MLSRGYKLDFWCFPLCSHSNLCRYSKGCGCHAGGRGFTASTPTSLWFQNQTEKSCHKGNKKIFLWVQEFQIESTQLVGFIRVGSCHYLISRMPTCTFWFSSLPSGFWSLQWRTTTTSLFHFHSVFPQLPEYLLRYSFQFGVWRTQGITKVGFLGNVRRR